MTDSASPIDPGVVEWSGENPGIYLKETPDGPWRALSVFFRIVLSPHGRGLAMLVLSHPDQAAGQGTGNFCITDNEPMSRYLIADFVSKFASFKNAAGLAAASMLPLTAARTVGDPRSSYAEIVESGGLRAEMRWTGLGRTFAVSVPPAMSATGVHNMYSVFVEGKAGSILVNDKALPGQIITRDFLGTRFSTAFLALCESWVRR